MNLPQISLSSPAGRDQILHHLRFSIDYLRRAGLLDHQGKPMNLFGIAGHLYYEEPSNLALVVLLRNGILHNIASRGNAQREFMLLMAHLFGRRYISKHLSSEIIRRSPSLVMLPPLREDARHVLMEHEREILRIFTSYALAFATQYAVQFRDDNNLPLSRRHFGGGPHAGDTVFRGYLLHTAIRTVARSPFVANSGHGDHFKSVQELARTARSGLHLAEYAIPSMMHIVGQPSCDEAPFALNAYLFDFFVHGQTKALEKANGIRRGDIWYALQDIVLSLKAVRAAVEELLLKASREDTESRKADEIDDSVSVNSSDSDSEGGPSLNRSSLAEVSDLDWKVYMMVRCLPVNYATFSNFL
jgi:hypothetical protein